MTWRWWRYWLEYALFRICLAVWQLLPPRQNAWVASGLAFLVHRFLPGRLTRCDVARENLRQAFGTALADREIDLLIGRMWAHLFRLIGEIANLRRRLQLQNLHEVIEFRNKPAVVGALLSGRPVMLLSGHFGNWEMAVSVFGLFGFPMGVVARELENPLLDRWFRDFRESTGHTMIAKKGCFDGIIERLEHGECLALLGDQDAGKGGVFVDFFGRPASTPKTIALLALQYEALICVGYARRIEEPSAGWVRYELGCEDVIDPREIRGDDAIREITQRYTAALERVIREAPEQYFWLHRRWKSEPRRAGNRRKEERQREAA